MSKKIILLTIDCLRRDRLILYGQHKNLVPHINKLSNEAYCFENTISNSSNTPPSFYSLFTSQLPSIKTPYAPLGINKQTIYKYLKKFGIKTCGIHSNPHIGIYCNYQYGFDDFFDMVKNPYLSFQRGQLFRYFNTIFNKILLSFNLIELVKKIRNKFWRLFNRLKSSTSEDNNEFISPYADAKKITNQAIEWLRNNYKSDFFLWIHYMDAHTPYFPPNENLRNIQFDEISEELKLEVYKIIDSIGKDPKRVHTIDQKKFSPIIEALYNAEINYLDHYLGILFMYLKKLKIYNDTIIILTADHGDELFDHNFLSHYASLYDELIRVPLLIKDKKSLDKPKSIPNLVELKDIAPTILDLIKLPLESSFQGVSLYPLIKDLEKFKHKNYIISLLLHNNKTTFTAYKKDRFKYYLLISCRSTDWKLIYDDQIKSIELYNLKEDPKELINLTSSQNSLVIKIKNKFLQRIKPYIKIYESEQGKIDRSISKFLFKNINLEKIED